jgi:Tol biopolymer transport system component
MFWLTDNGLSCQTGRVSVISIALATVILELWRPAVIARAEIVPRPILETPWRVWVLSESQSDSLSRRAWNNKVYNLFDDPVGFCMLPAGNESDDEHFFVLDQSEDILRFFGTVRDQNGRREVNYFKSYGSGEGTGIGFYRRPNAITVSPRGPGCMRYVYVLDAGNGRVEKLEFSSCGWTLAHMSYVVDGDLPGYGPLNDARDIDYIQLRDNDVATDDFLVIADYGNHRVIAITPEGQVRWVMGGPDPGDGASQFAFPIAVTGVRVSPETDEAFIYVADRGNNRVVKLYQDNNWNIHWDAVYEFPTEKTRTLGDVGGHSLSGLEDVEVDAEEVHSGVFVLNSENGEVVQLDFALTEMVDRFDGFSYHGAPLHDLELSRGELAVTEPYTSTTGLEVFEVRSSVENLTASPNPFVPPLEWVSARMTITARGALSVWVTGPVPQSTRVTTLIADWPVYPGTEYAIWDGKDSTGVGVQPDKTYTLNARVEDEYWGYQNTKQIQVRVRTDSSFIVVNPPPSVTVARHPAWSPDGSEIVYSAGENDTLSVMKLDISTGTEVILSPGLDGVSQVEPSWSVDGQKIAWAKRLPDAMRSLIYTMNADGSGKAMLSDPTGAPPWFWEHKPRWAPTGGALSYLRTGSTGADTLKNHVLSTGQKRIVTTPGPEVIDFAWSPNGDRVAFVTGQGDLPCDELYVYDVDGKYYTRLLEVPDSGRTIEGLGWSPDGRYVLFTDYTFWASHGIEGTPEFRSNVMAIPWNGGVPVPVGGFTRGQMQIEEGVSWSPDGTKVVVPIRAISSTDLVATDFIRGPRAFPAATVFRPLAQEVVSDVVAVVGTVDDNIRVWGDSTLSGLHDFNVRWGRGARPANWSNYGIDLRYGCPEHDPSCPIVNDTLATWNTGVVESGIYTLRLVASDGVDSNVVYRLVTVAHRSYTVKAGGSGDFTTIQAAMAAAQMGDTVKVYAGEYTGTVDMKETVVLIGVEDGVRVKGGDAPGLRIFDHDYPCRVDRVCIRNTQYLPQTRGIWIDDASPVIRDCEISGHNSDYPGAGVYVTGNSFPQFIRCTIRGNDGAAGAGLYVNGVGSNRPAPIFQDCRIVSNVAKTGNYGGGIKLGYAEPLDTTFQQPRFTNCVIDSNAATKGAAMYLMNCYAPLFSGCSISANHVQSTSSSNAAIDGSYSGFRGFNCTFARNYGDAALLNQSLISLGSLPGINYAARLERSIVAFNGVRGFFAESYAWVDHSVFFGNPVNDAYWRTHGEGNLNKDPAFCDFDGADYSLYAFSPCAPSVSTVGLIGACDVECVPTCDVTADSCAVYPPPHVLTTCPAGDADTLVVRLDFADPVITRRIEAEEIRLGPNYDDIVFFHEGFIIADVDADSAGGFQTTLTHRDMSGCCTTQVSVLLDNQMLDERPSIIVRSPDIDRSGWVNLVDMSLFSAAYPPHPYHPCADFDANGSVTLGDLSIFASHQDHRYQASSLAATIATEKTSQQPPVAVELTFMESRTAPGQHKLLVTVALAELETLDVMSVSLDISHSALVFQRWVPSDLFPARTLAVPIHRDGRDELFIAGFSRKVVGVPSRVLGTIEFGIKNDSELSLRESDFEVVRGGILTADGVTRDFDGLRTTANAPREAVYGDYLAQNHPNPFNPSTTVEYSISEDAHIDLAIFNVKGQLVRTLENGLKKRHNYRIVWDGKSDKGEDVASGTYFLRLKTDRFTQTRKLVVLR